MRPQVDKSVRKYDRNKANEDEDDKLTFTSDSTDVQAVSHGTFTSESAVCVDALAIDARVIKAFINICG